MNSNDAHLKAPLKGELLRFFAQQYPELDFGTVVIASQIQSVARAFSAHINNDLAKYGLTEGKFYVLVFLFSEEVKGNETPGPSEIADHVGVTRGTVTGLLDGLEREEFVERRFDNRDRRALTIALTDKARSFMDEFLRTSSQMFTQAMPLDEAELQTLNGYLSRIAETLNIDEACCD